MSDRIPTWLRHRARPPILPGEDRRESLERQLAARFGTARKESTVITVLFRAGVAAGLLAAVGATASQVPATYQAEVGKHVEIRTAEPPPPGALQSAVKAIESGAEGGRREIRVRVRVLREPGAGTLSTLDVWGDTIGMDGIPDAIRRAVPELGAAAISVRPVEGTVEGDLGGMVGTKVLGERLSGAQVEATMRRLEAEAARLEADAARLEAEGKRLEADRARLEAEVKRDLAASGVDGNVEVDVKAGEEGGKVRREVKVIVTKEKPAGGH